VTLFAEHVFCVGPYVYPSHVMPVTVNVSVLRGFFTCTDVNTITPFASVVPKTNAFVKPLQLPVTFAPAAALQ